MRFYYKELILDVPDSVYYPREDSLLLAKVLEKEQLGKCLDMGCGSGFLAILMAKANEVVAIDINEEAVRIAKENAAKNRVSMRSISSDLFSEITEGFDLIVFNPPYLPERSNNNQYSGGETGRAVIEKFIRQSKNHLEENGKILLLLSSLTGEKEVLGIFHSNRFSAKVVAREKIPWEELMVIEAYKPF